MQEAHLNSTSYSLELISKFYNLTQEEKEEYLIGETNEQKLRYFYLIHKFFKGKSLKDRTKIENEGGLLEACMGECSTVMYGLPYCRISLRGSLQCSYLANVRQPHNPFFVCNYFYKLGEQKPQSAIVPELFRRDFSKN